MEFQWARLFSCCTDPAITIVQGLHMNYPNELKENAKLLSEAIQATRSSLPERFYWKETTPQHYLTGTGVFFSPPPPSSQRVHPPMLSCHHHHQLASSWCTFICLSARHAQSKGRPTSASHTFTAELSLDEHEPHTGSSFTISSV